jgi:PKD repeat protein
MKTSFFLINATMISIWMLAGLLLLLQSCDLEVIPPTSSKTKSNFTFALEDSECTANCKVMFTNTSQNATSYEWRFGDESAISTLQDPVHTYATGGTYEVNLKAMRDTVAHDTTMTIVINETPFQASTHVVTAANVTGYNFTYLNNSLTDNIPSKIIVVTPVLGKRNPSALGVWYNGKWSIFNQDLTNMQVDDKYTVVVTDPSNSNAFVHQTTAANLRTAYISTLDHPSVNNKPNARVFITPIWEQSTDYNTHPVGVVYTNNRWEIMNLDQANLPVALKFNVIVSHDSKSFVHTSSATSISADYTKIDNAKINSKPDLKVMVTSTQGTSASPVINPHQVGLWYFPSQGQWTVFNEGYGGMPQNSSFNILFLE